MFYANLLADKLQGRVYSDLTGKFLVQFYTGNKYVFIMCVYVVDTIFILHFEVMYKGRVC